MSVHVINSNLMIVDETLGSQNGQTDGIVKIGNPNTDEVYGFIEYSTRNGKLRINNVSVEGAYAKKGYATYMTNHLKKTYKNIDITPVYSVPMNQITNIPQKRSSSKKPASRKSTHKSTSRRKK